MQHGKDCEKVPHTGDGYLHAEDDDTLYDVDNVSYCGRCHGAVMCREPRRRRPLDRRVRPATEAKEMTMTEPEFMQLVNRYTEACDDLGAGLFEQTEAETKAKHARASELFAQIRGEVSRLHAALTAEREKWRGVVSRAATDANRYGREGLTMRCTASETGQLLSWEVVKA